MKKCEIVIANLGSVDFAQVIRLAALGINKRNNEIRKELLNTTLKPEEEEALKDLLSLRGQDGVNVNHELCDLLNGNTAKQDRYQSGHLLFEGISRLFSSLFNDKKSRTRIGIVSEFGRELGSFRHKVAEAMNIALLSNAEGTTKRRIISGDKDMAIGLSNRRQICAHSVLEHCNKPRQCQKEHAKFTFRCTLCHQWVCLPCIKEHSIRHYDQSIFYNCDIDWKPSYYPRPPLIRL